MSTRVNSKYTWVSPMTLGQNHMMHAPKNLRSTEMFRTMPARASRRSVIITGHTQDIRKANEFYRIPQGCEEKHTCPADTPKIDVAAQPAMKQACYC